MEPLTFYQERAATYESLSKDYYNWLSSEVLFGLTYEFVMPGETLFDVGIGTGLSSALFYKSGLKISGMDYSPDMLAVCAAKGFDFSLTQHDLTKYPWPYGDQAFHHIIACDVFAHYKELAKIFDEIARIVKPQGLFAFTTEYLEQGDQEEFCWHDDQNNLLTLYRYGGSYIKTLLQQNGFRLLKSLKFDALIEKNEYSSINAYVARKEP